MIMDKAKVLALFKEELEPHTPKKQKKKFYGVKKIWCILRGRRDKLDCYKNYETRKKNSRNKKIVLTSYCPVANDFSHNLLPKTPCVPDTSDEHNKYDSSNDVSIIDDAIKNKGNTKSIEVNKVYSTPRRCIMSNSSEYVSSSFKRRCDSTDYVATDCSYFDVSFSLDTEKKKRVKFTRDLPNVELVRSSANTFDITRRKRYSWYTASGITNSSPRPDSRQLNDSLRRKLFDASNINDTF